MKNTRMEQLKEFLKDQPGEPFLKYALATEYLKMGDQANALSYFEELIKDHSQYLGTYYHLGKLYQSLGRIPEAAVVYRSGIQLARDQGNTQTLAELNGALADLSEDEDEEA